ncbi:hypothetical protein CMI48_00810 [Candidatus Pacearchaeota archaeon]|nr:hypothetical protein [Candidatus Pacearchaeota archaeon]|tara:strand:+ start:168 stop:434 length:267 start_codon:yes stop_codon:yes gene_type:complete
MQKDIIKARLLYHLRKKKVLGGVHTHFDTLTKGFPKHMGKDVKNIAKELIKQGWLITKPTNYGLQVSLNKDSLGEIESFIKHTLHFSF